MGHILNSRYSCRDIGHILAGATAITANDDPTTLWLPYKPLLLLSEALAALQRHHVKEFTDLTYNCRRECRELPKIVHDAGTVFTPFDHENTPVRAYLRVNVTREHAPELLAMVGIEPSYGRDVGSMLREELARAITDYAVLSKHLSDPRTH